MYSVIQLVFGSIRQLERPHQTLLEQTVLHKNVSAKRQNWLASNRPRGQNAESYTDYKRAKAEFKKAQRVAVTHFIDEQKHELDTAAEVDGKYVLET